MDVVQTYTFIDPYIAAPMVAGAPEGWRTTLDKLDKLVVLGPIAAAKSSGAALTRGNAGVDTELDPVEGLV